MTFGELLCRMRAGRPRREIADALGVTAAAIGHYERGDRTPSADVLPRLYDALQMDHEARATADALYLGREPYTSDAA